MQNASKMLIMAASVLIGIFIISVFVYLFRIGASTNQKYDERQSQAQLELYNNKFQTYNVQDNTIMDMLSVINLAYNTNIDTNYDEGWAVKIDIVVGNKKFQISDKKNDNNPLDRNEIYFDNTAKEDLSSGDGVDIYKLVSLPIREPSPNPDRITNTLDLNDSKIRGKYPDKLSTTTYDSFNNKTVYKFLFECKEIKYHESTGRISYMKFEIKNNDEYDEIVNKN